MCQIRLRAIMSCFQKEYPVRTNIHLRSLVQIIWGCWGTLGLAGLNKIETVFNEQTPSAVFFLGSISY